MILISNGYWEDCLSNYGDETNSDDGLPDKREETYFAAINALAGRVLDRCSPEEAPMLAIEAVLRLARFRQYIQPYRTVKDVGQGAASNFRSATPGVLAQRRSG